MKVAILHEGNSKSTHDNGIIKLLLQELDLDEDKVEFFGFGFKSNFFKSTFVKYENLKLQIEEESIGKILFVVDADYAENDKKYGGLENTNTELEKIIKELGLTDISNIYVTRDPNTQEGYLESLILSSIPEEQKDCIESFLKCSNFKSKENHKSILNQIYKIAYPNAPYDFSHKNFDELKQKLKNLFEE
jgi:hypothetical protein